MNTCKEFDALPIADYDAISQLISHRVSGRSHVADITIEKSDLRCYDFKVTVCKYNTVKGWATIAYMRKTGRSKSNGWVLTFKPGLSEGESKVTAGKVGAYY